MVLTMRRAARHDCVFARICALVKKRSFRTPLKSLQFKARRADFRFFYRRFCEKHTIITSVTHTHTHTHTHIYVHMCTRNIASTSFLCKSYQGSILCATAFTTLSIKFVSDNVFTDFSYVSSNWYE